MANEQKDNTDEEFSPTPQESSAFGEKNNIAGSQLNKDSDNEKHEEKHSEPKENIIINMPPNNDGAILAEAQRANRLTKGGLIINSLLFFCTIIALSFTWWSVDVANKSLSDTRKRNKVTDSMSAIQYEEMNRPLVQAGDFMVEDFEVGKIPKVNYLIFNLGKFPAKVIDVKSWAFLAPTDMKGTNFSDSGKKKVRVANSAVAGVAFIPASEPLKSPPTKEEYALYKSGKSSIYFFYVNRYKPFAAYDKTYTNTCVYRITFGEKRPNITCLKNDEE